MAMTKQVNLEIMEYVEKNILPRYAAFDRAHQISHAKSVINRSLDIAEKIGANIDMAYVVAAYHDLGLEGHRAIHHTISGKILQADKNLLRWFSPSEINIMKEAVEDHRASLSHSPRNIYGKIVAEADRDLSPETVFRRTIEYGLDHYPEKDKEEQWQRFMDHLNQKYSTHGYIHLWIPGSQNEKDLKTIQQLIDNKALLRERFEAIWKDLSFPDLD